MNTPRRYQYGSLTRRKRIRTEDVWQFRYYETSPPGAWARAVLQSGKRIDCVPRLSELHHCYDLAAYFQSSEAALAWLFSGRHVPSLIPLIRANFSPVEINPNQADNRENGQECSLPNVGAKFLMRHSAFTTRA
jgi:hypothetical protein